LTLSFFLWESIDNAEVEKAYCRQWSTNSALVGIGLHISFVTHLFCAGSSLWMKMLWVYVPWQSRRGGRGWSWWPWRGWIWPKPWQRLLRTLCVVGARVFSVGRVEREREGEEG
jgi:hypothetical protein